jgi:hypothetical protein
MSYQVLEETPYGGEIHVLTEATDLQRLPVAGQKLLSAYQMEQFQAFPASLLALAETVTLPYVAEWLHKLVQASTCRLEVCLTEYADPMVFVRYAVAEKWHPALSFQSTHGLPYKTPALLRQVYDIVGRVNFDGYGYAGGLLCPPDTHPVLGSYNEWRDENAPDYKDFMAFYQNWTSDLLLVNAEGEVGWYVHDDSSACRLIGEVDDVLPTLFAKLTAGAPFEPGDI